MRVVWDIHFWWPLVVVADCSPGRCAMSTTIRQPAIFTLLGLNQVPVRTHLVWDSADPLAIVLRFRASCNGPVEWVVSRELVIDALATADVYGVGQGDVRWYPETTDSLLLELASPSGHAVFRVPRETLIGLLADIAAVEADCPSDPLDWIPDTPAWLINSMWGDAA